MSFVRKVKLLFVTLIFSFAVRLLIDSKHWEVFMFLNEPNDYNHNHLIDQYYQAYFYPSTKSISHENATTTLIVSSNQDPGTPSLPAFLQPTTITHNTNNSGKPTLFLHVGPLKTATTSIYFMLGKKVIYNTLLENDHIRFMKKFSYMDMNKVLRNCLNYTNTEAVAEDCSEWDRLLGLFRDLYPSNVVHSVEIYSKFPYTSKSISMLRSLSDVWNVRILLSYRRPYSWYASAYHQYRKFFIYKSRGGRYAGFDTKRRSVQLTFPEFLEQRRPILADSLRTFQFYKHVFGDDNVRVLNFYAADGIEREFLCNGLDAEHACQKAKGIRFKKVNQLKFLLDEDYLAISAYGKGYFSGGGNSYKSRNDIVKTLHKEFFATEAASLPKLCLSKQQNEWLWNRTLTSERVLTTKFANANSSTANADESVVVSLSQQELWTSFENESHKWCTVDAQTLLQNETWKRRLRSCLFQKKNDGCNFVE
jgi:hypothetical protein